MPWNGDRPRMILSGIFTGAARTDLAVFFVSESARWNGSIVAKKNMPHATSGADAVTLWSVPRSAIAVAFNVQEAALYYDEGIINTDDCKNNKVGAIVHMGDHAYNLGYSGDRRGDAYMNAMQPLLATCAPSSS